MEKIKIFYTIAFVFQICFCANNGIDLWVKKHFIISIMSFVISACYGGLLIYVLFFKKEEKKPMQPIDHLIED